MQSVAREGRRSKSKSVRQREGRLGGIGPREEGGRDGSSEFVRILQRGRWRGALSKLGGRPKGKLLI